MIATATDQRMAALEKANGIRIAKADLKRQLLGLDRLGSKTRAAKLLVEPDEVVERMDVSELLRSVRGFGPTKVRKVLRAGCVSGWRKVGALTERERGLLASLVRSV